MRYSWKKNRMVTSMLAFAAALLLFASNPLEAKAYIQTQGTVISDSAVIRKSPDASSEAIASIVKGNKVTINNEEKDAGGVIWYKVFVDANTLGYVRGDLIQKEGGSAATTPTETPSTNTSTPSETTPAEPEKPKVNADVTIGTSTTVTPVESQGATVANNGVRIRSEASANSTIVTQVNKATAITVNGKADGADGKVWYYVSFIVDSKEVKGFIRSDFVTLSQELVILNEEPAADEPVQPEEPTDEPAQEPIVNTDFELKYEPDAEGINDWYLYNNVDGVRNKLSEILDAVDDNGNSVEVANSQLKKQKVVIIILAIVLVFMALAVTLLLFKLRDMYYEDFDEPDEEPRRPGRASPNPRTVNPSQKQRPVPRPNGGQRPSGQGQPRPNGGQRPAGQGQPRPNGGQRPAGQGQPRPNGGQRPAGQGQPRPNGGQRPAGQGQPRPNGGQHPSGQGQPRPNGGQRPAGQSQPIPPVQKERPAQEVKPEAGWKPKNFMAEDDDLEFEFLNWDGEER